jgi:hypothetical protein
MLLRQESISSRAAQDVPFYIVASNLEKSVPYTLKRDKIDNTANP